jgi:ribosomal protein S18 acetylase RimI-like enzyme
VLRDAMRLGYGTSLLQELKSRMLQERLPCTVVTYVPPANEVGQRLFQKLDFQWVWTEPDFGARARCGSFAGFPPGRANAANRRPGQKAWISGPQAHSKILLQKDKISIYYKYSHVIISR